MVNSAWLIDQSCLNLQSLFHNFETLKQITHIFDESIENKQKTFIHLEPCDFGCGEKTECSHDRKNLLCNEILDSYGKNTDFDT